MVIQLQWQPYTALSRKVVGQNVHAITLVIWIWSKHCSGWHWSCQTLLLLLSLSTGKHTLMASRAILSNFSEEQWTQNHPHNFSGLIVGCTFSDNFPRNSWMPIESTQTVPQWLSMRHWGKSFFYLLHMTILYTVPYFIYFLSLSLYNVLHINPTDGKRFGSFQIRN